MSDKPEDDELTIDQIVGLYCRIRDKLAATTKEYEAKKRKAKADMNFLSAELLSRANKLGVESFPTKMGTAYKDEDWKASIADDTLFFDFVREQDDLAFFTRRISVEHLREYMKAHPQDEFPPGLNVFRSYRMKVRAPAKGRDPVSDDTQEEDEE